jgi:hypothetical protein
MMATLGANPSTVSNADSLTSTPRDAQYFHLMRTLVAHQKLDTLSSNSPREKGKIRVIGCVVSESDAKGGEEWQE